MPLCMLLLPCYLYYDCALCYSCFVAHTLPVCCHVFLKDLFTRQHADAVPGGHPHSFKRLPRKEPAPLQWLASSRGPKDHRNTRIIR